MMFWTRSLILDCVEVMSQALISSRKGETEKPVELLEKHLTTALGAQNANKLIKEVNQQMTNTLEDSSNSLQMRCARSKQPALHYDVFVSDGPQIHPDLNILDILAEFTIFCALIAVLY